MNVPCMFLGTSRISDCAVEAAMICTRTSILKWKSGFLALLACWNHLERLKKITTPRTQIPDSIVCDWEAAQMTNMRSVWKTMGWEVT